MIEHQKTRNQRYHNHRDRGDIIAIFLSDGPKMLVDLEQQFITLPRRFGFFVELVDQESIDRGEMKQILLHDLNKMREAGWVDCQDEHFKLTPQGLEMAAEKLAGLRQAMRLANNLLQPQTVSKISLGVHLGLAAIKLPAGLLSGSVGLINDGADTLLDGLASLMVYFGIRYNRERPVNIILVLLMLITGCLTFYEAVQRLYTPLEPDLDWFTFLAAAFSALLCLALWGYQRYVGLRSASMSLITQSVDSRNHVIVALSVTAGLIASLLRFSFLDTVVGLAVAVLILKSAVELGIETIRSLKEGEVNLSRYRMSILDRYDQFRKAQLRDWMLYLVDREEVTTLAALRLRACQAFDFTGNPALRGLGLDQIGEVNQLVDQSLCDLYEQGWLEGDDQLVETDAGREHLSRQLNRFRGRRRR